MSKWLLPFAIVGFLVWYLFLRKTNVAATTTAKPINSIQLGPVGIPKGSINIAPLANAGVAAIGSFFNGLFTPSSSADSNTLPSGAPLPNAGIDTSGLGDIGSITF